MSEEFTARIDHIRSMLDFTTPKIVSIILNDEFPASTKLSIKQRDIVWQLQQSLVRLEIYQNVSNYFYLLESDWYIHNPELQALVLYAVRRGLGPRINTRATNFEKDLDDLFLEQEKMFAIMCSNITNFEYLESRNWFMQNWTLQEKVFKVVLAGFGNKINVDADNFNEHINSFYVCE